MIRQKKKIESKQDQLQADQEKQLIDNGKIVLIFLFALRLQLTI